MLSAACGVSSFDSRFLHSVRCTISCRQFTVRIGPPGGQTLLSVRPDIAGHMRTGKSAVLPNPALHAYIFFDAQARRRKWVRTVPGPRDFEAESSRSRRARSGRNESTRSTGECGWRISAIRTFISFDHFSCLAMAATVLCRKAILAAFSKSCDSVKKELSSAILETARDPADESTGDARRPSPRSMIFGPAHLRQCARIAFLCEARQLDRRRG